MAPILPSPHVRYGRVHDIIVILDLRKDKYILLDDVAATMWEALIALGTDWDSMVGTLCERFEVERTRLEADLSCFLASCRKQGLLCLVDEHPTRPVDSIPRPPASSRFIFWRALWTLVDVLFRLRFGVDRIYEDSEHLAGSVRVLPHDQINDHVIARALSAFVLAENICPSSKAPDDCLPRSLAAFRFLRSLGFPVTHRIGVTRYPIRVHAWVELGSRTLFGDQLAWKYVPIASIE